MSLIGTKPNYTEVIATDRGWEDVSTGELLVAIKNLKTLLNEEIPTTEVDVFVNKKTKTKKEKTNGR